MYFVSSGEVCVTIYSVSGKAVSFRDLGPEAIFGEYAAIDGGPRSASRLVPPPKHADIASRVSTHREAVTRELNRLERIGVIERGSGVLVIRDVDRLAEMLHKMPGE